MTNKKSYMDEWRRKNAARLKEWQRQYNARPYVQAKKKLRVRLDHVTRRYGLSQEHYEALVKIQRGRCAICDRHEYRKRYRSDGVRRLCVDHDHKTGKIRGLLCHDCNLALGYIKDDAVTAQAIVHYLKFGTEQVAPEGEDLETAAAGLGGE